MDIYGIITDRLVAEMESGIIPWHKPWVGGVNAPVKHISGEPYSLLNQLLLGEPGEYLSYKQCQNEGGHVKKGAKSRIVVFWTMLQRDKKDKDGHVVIGKDGNPAKETIPFLKYSNVFHIRDCEGIKPKWGEDISGKSEVEASAEAEEIATTYLDREKITLRHLEQGRAYYSPATDSITLPLMKQFTASAEYYSTLFHEMTHSTGHPSRLNRLDKAAAFGNEEYSKEELCAELGAAFLLSHVGIETPESFKNNAAYLQNWLKALKNDKRMIVSAAGKAEKAVNFILGAE